MSRGGRSDLLAVLFIVGGLILVILLLTWRAGSGGGGTELRFTGDRVGVVDVIGPIYDSRRWTREIDEFRRNDRVKAIVVRIDSPGGGVAASQELYAALRRARKEKPVVASLGGVAASGGYYAALGADSIVANPGTTTGSIGVLIELARFEDLMRKVGVAAEVIKSGEFKDSGSPFRRLTPRERTYLQGYVNDAFEQFAEAVGKERGLAPAAVKEIADGRVFTGRQALAAGLVDLLGDQYEAVRLAARMAGMKGEPQVVRPPRARRLEWLEWVMDEAAAMLARRLNAQPEFQYRWRPGGAE